MNNRWWIPLSALITAFGILLLVLSFTSCGSTEHHTVTSIIESKCAKSHEQVDTYCDSHSSLCYSIRSTVCDQYTDPLPVK